MLNYCQEFDDTYDDVDVEYMNKVFKIASGDEDVWKMIELSIETLKMFEMRERNNWKGADSIFDAWLLFHKKRRSWFPYYVFITLFPVYKEIQAATPIPDFDNGEEVEQQGEEVEQQGEEVEQQGEEVEQQVEEVEQQGEEVEQQVEEVEQQVEEVEQ